MTIKLILTFILLFFCSSAWAVTATFQEGVSSYAGTSDATITSISTNEHITDSTVKMRAFADGPVYILHFDISSIPSTATVSSATVQLYVSEQNCTDETMGVRSIENPDNSGAFADNDAAVDEFNANATWLYKNDTTNTDWDVTASNNFADVDDNANETTASSGSCPGSVARTWTITTMTQGWVTTPNSNGGMVFSLANTGNVIVKSKRTATSSERPLLTVNYTDAGAATAGNVYSNMVIQGGFINK